MIVKAAIRFRGKTYVGWRHCFILEDIRQALGIKAVHTTDQGFLTDLGEYVDRTRAAEIAIACGQIKKTRYQPNSPFSEEMWSKNGIPEVQ